jgi:hypothetical protein
MHDRDDCSTIAADIASSTHQLLCATAYGASTEIATSKAAEIRAAIYFASY